MNHVASYQKDGNTIELTVHILYGSHKGVRSATFQSNNMAYFTGLKLAFVVTKFPQKTQVKGLQTGPF